MENHPIDDLFARKLRDIDAPVNPTLFNRLKSQSGGRVIAMRSRLFWISAIAAACLIAVVSGLYWQNRLVMGSESLIKVETNLRIRPNKGTGYVPVEEVQKKLYQVEKATVHQERKVIQISSPINQNSNVVRSKALKEISLETPKFEGVLAVEPVRKLAGFGLKGEELVGKINTEQPVNRERGVLLTLSEVSADMSNKHVLAAQPEAIDTSGRVAGLWNRLKQLKSGDVLVRVTNTPNPDEQRTRLGRVWNGLKESIRNENTLE